ncbi:MAG: Smr/MutS family protein [Holosporales bacterium]|nr:Smr/MutS family protein [Holosporales bacterium]
MDDFEDLSERDAALWEAHVRDIQKLQRKERIPESQNLKEKRTVAPPKKSMPQSVPAGEKNPPQPLNLGRRARRALRATARCDLHGYSAQEAFQVSWQFLEESAKKRHRVVLLITGKGRNSPEGRDSLQKLVPEWLQGPPFSSCVCGFSQATPQYGGAGALYVFLRNMPESEPSL